MKITAVILTKNEEKNIERCLESVSFCNEIIIIDDYSEDKTIEIVRKVGNKNFCSVHKRKLNNDFASQRNFGLSKANNDWVLFIDADEEVSEELKKEITSLFQFPVVEIDAFYLKRRDFFWEKELKYGEVRQIRKTGLIRLIRRDSGQWMGTVHEIFHTANKVGQIKGFLNHFPHPTLKEFINDINYYSTIRSEDLFNRGVKTNIFENMFFPFGKFVYNYFLNFGFIDGPSGFAYAFMMSFHSFLVRAKLYQLTNKQ